MKELNKKLVPIVHAIKTSPNMMMELARIPLHIKRQNKDWKTIIGDFPQLIGFEKELNQLNDLFRTAHNDYVSNYSAPLISMSLNRGAFFYFFCKKLKPKHILDLGTGFSSYIFRYYQKEVNPNAVVYSVDDSKFWLDETKVFLSSYQLPTDNLITLEESKRDKITKYDLIFLDIGDIPLRIQLLPSLIEKVKQGSMLLIDDFHSPHYRKEIETMCTKMDVKCYSLRKVTRTRLSHNAIVLR